MKVIVELYSEAENSKFFYKIEKSLPVYTVSNNTRRYSLSGTICHIFVFIIPEFMRAIFATAHNSRCKY